MRTERLSGTHEMIEMLQNMKINVPAISSAAGALKSAVELERQNRS